MNMNDYQNEFDKILSRKYFPEKLNNSRKKAFSKFLDIGIPSRKWEDWRHTDLYFLNKNQKTFVNGGPMAFLTCSSLSL